MKIQNRLLNLLLTSMLALMLSACDSKSIQDENNMTDSQKPTSQTTEDISADRDVVSGGTNTATTWGTTTSASGGTSTSSGSATASNNGGTDTFNGGSNNSNSTGNSDDTTSSGGTNVGGGDSNNSSGNSNQSTTNSITKLNLIIDDTALNKDASTTLKVEATYKDKTTKELTNQVHWLITPNDAIKITGNALTALKDTNVTIQAIVGSTKSNQVNLSIYREVNGFKLPPEPDEKKNNETLLGIDFNQNGIRDDVERWIITHYANDPKYPKTKTAIALQYAWAAQKILENPTMDSKKYLDDALDCQYYWLEKKTENLSGFEFGKFAEQHKVVNTPELKDVIYNTRQRIEQKFKFNAALSGNIFDGRERSVSNCRTNIDKIGE